MRINNNLMAMNTHRQLGTNTANGSKSIEKLSSGLRINRAGDDAAGLAISEKMRAQIRGLNMASKNSQDGISLIQTAEGALNETHSILQRMRELAVQSANDTNVTADRSQIQQEMNQLSSEVNRIANTTEFNTMKLLNGDRAIATTSSSTTTTQIVSGTATITDIVDYSVSNNATVKFQDTMVSGAISVAAGDFLTSVASSGASIKVQVKDSGTLTITLQGDDTGAGQAFSAVDDLVADANGNFVYNDHGVTFEIKGSAFSTLTTGATLNITSYSGNGTVGLKDDINQVALSSAVTVSNFSVSNSASNADLKNARSVVLEHTGGNKFSVTIKDGSGNALFTDVYNNVSGSATINYDAHGIKLDFGVTTADLSAATTISSTISLTPFVSSTTTTKTVVTDDKSMKFQVGANQSQQMSLDISDMKATALSISGSSAGSASLTINGSSVTAYYTSDKKVTDGTNATTTEYALDISSATKAGAAVTVINAAIETVSTERAKLGAVQNRLEHTISNLDTSAENLQAAESRIRDVDMAKEMMNLTKNNILTQAAQAMLAQANQAPQGVLQLLR